MDNLLEHIEEEYAKKPEYDAYEYKEGDKWLEVDPTVADKLDDARVNQKSPIFFDLQTADRRTVSYKVASDASDPASHMFIQTNLHTQFQRKIRWVKKDAMKKLKYDSLYKSAYIRVGSKFAHDLLHNLDLTTITREEQQWFLSLPLAELAEKRSSLGANYIYHIPSEMATSKVNYESDGLACMCEAWVKPLCLFNWLQFAAGGAYSHAILVTHGSKSEYMTQIRVDPMGWSRRFIANMQLHGSGSYIDLGDTIAKQYKDDRDADGTAILSLLLCHFNIEIDPDGKQNHSFKKRFCLCPPHDYSNRNVQNAMVVDDMRLLLQLGKIVPYEPDEMCMPKEE